MKPYGGEDGLTLIQRSQIGLGIDTADEASLYYVVLAVLAGTMFLLNRALQARFGRALIGIRENEARMEAIGFRHFPLPPRRLRHRRCDRGTRRRALR